MIALSTSSDMTKDYITRIVPFNQIHEITAKWNYSASSYREGYRKGENVQSLGNVLIYDFDGQKTSGTNDSAPVFDGQKTSGTDDAAPVFDGQKTSGTNDSAPVFDDGTVTFGDMAEYLQTIGVTALLCTSRNHQKEKNGKPACDRFRLFVPLSGVMKVRHEDYSEFYMFAAKVMRIDDLIDTSCQDRSRFYFPNPNQEIKYINTGNVLDSAILETNFQIYLTEQRLKQKPERKPTAKPAHQAANGMKRNEVPRDTDIELKGGEVKLLYEFEYLEGNETVPCRCINPTHEDRHPSAFVGRSKSGGGLQVTCKGCGYTVYAAKE